MTSTGIFFSALRAYVCIYFSQYLEKQSRIRKGKLLKRLLKDILHQVLERDHKQILNPRRWNFLSKGIKNFFLRKFKQNILQYIF